MLVQLMITPEELRYIMRLVGSDIPQHEHAKLIPKLNRARMRVLLKSDAKAGLDIEEVAT